MEPWLNQNSPFPRLGGSNLPRLALSERGFTLGGLMTLDEIHALESELMACIDTDAMIDSKKVKRLCDLRESYLQELIATHDQRLDIMKRETRKMTETLAGITFEGKPDVQEQLLEQQDKYDVAAVHWVLSESCQWGESEAASLAAGIIILAAS